MGRAAGLTAFGRAGTLRPQVGVVILATQDHHTVHILLATTGYPPEHSGAGGRLHAMYKRLAAADATFRWSVLTKARGKSGLAVSGPVRVVAFERGVAEYPSLLEAGVESFWATRQLASGLLNGIDLVHSAGWTWTVPPLLWHARRRNIPIVRELTTQGDGGGETLGGRLIRWCNRQASQIVAISPALAEAARPHIATDVPIWCRPNGVDVSRFRPADPVSRAHHRAKLEKLIGTIDEGSIVVLHVGRIRPLKNQLLLANAVARLPLRFKLVLAGPAYNADDDYVGLVRRRIAEADLTGRAALIEGNLSDIEALMQGADLFAFPSTQEGLGTVMIEALCCGLPVVASRLRGVTDWVVKEGKNGFLAERDVASLAKRLADATALLSLRDEIAAEAAKTYDQTSMDAQYRALFQRMRVNP